MSGTDCAAVKYPATHGAIRNKAVLLLYLYYSFIFKVPRPGDYKVILRSSSRAATLVEASRHIP